MWQDTLRKNIFRKITANGGSNLSKQKKYSRTVLRTGRKGQVISMNNEPNFNNQGAGQNPTPQYAPDPFEDKPVPASRGLSITSLVLGILSVLGCCCCTPLGAALGVVAVVLAIVYSKRAGKLDGMALAGLILGIIGIVFSVIAIIIVGLNSELYMEYYEDILNQAISQGGLTLQ